MTIRKLLLIDWPLLLLIALLLGAGVWVYPHLPQRVPVHWGIGGQVNGYGPKWFGAFGLGILALGMYALFAVLPVVDPRRKNYPAFLSTYRLLRWIVILVVLLAEGIILAAGLGYHPAVGLIIRLAVSLMVIAMGNPLGKVRPNYFVGIRTPWTLANEAVWRKTHRLAGPLWVAGGIVLCFVSFLPGAVSVVPFFGLLGLLVLIPAVYSYRIYPRDP